jgi:3-hydroxyacyl-CoA dehydrogenase
MAGLDILVHTQRILQQAFPHHGDLSRIATRLVELGQRGQKTGGGVYRYDPAGRDALDSPLTADLIAEVRDSVSPAQAPGDSGRIAERLVLRMVSEAYLTLEEGIARSADDVDVATVMGVGFPDFRGGVCRYARDLGLDCVRDRLEEFTQRLGPRYKPCGLIRTT